MAVTATTRDLPTLLTPQPAFRSAASPAAGSMAAIRFTIPTGDSPSDVAVSPSVFGQSPSLPQSLAVQPTGAAADPSEREVGTTGFADTPTNLILVAGSSPVAARDGRVTGTPPAHAPGGTRISKAAVAPVPDAAVIAGGMSEREIGAIATTDARDEPRADATDEAGAHDETLEEPLPTGASFSTGPQSISALVQSVLPQTVSTGIRAATASDGFGRDSASLDVPGRVEAAETGASGLPRGASLTASASVRSSPSSIEMLAPADPVQGARIGEGAASAADVPPNGPASGVPVVKAGIAFPSGLPAPLPAADPVASIPANGIVYAAASSLPGIGRTQATGQAGAAPDTNARISDRAVPEEGALEIVSMPDEFIMTGPSLSATSPLVPPLTGEASPVPPSDDAPSPDAAGSDIASASADPARPNPIAERPSAVPVVEADAKRIGADRDVSAKDGFDGLVAATAGAATDLGPAYAPNVSATASPVNAAPVAASDANATPVPAQAAPVPLGAVPMTVGLRSLAGSNRFEIRLDPKELGRIDVNLDIDKETGTVTAHLVVDRPETLALLQRDAGNLQQALSQAGLDSNEASINLSLRGDGHSNGSNGAGQDDRSGRNGAPGGTPGSDQPEPRHSPDAKPLRSLSGLTGIDIRI